MLDCVYWGGGGDDRSSCTDEFRGLKKGKQVMEGNHRRIRVGSFMPDFL